MSDIPQIGRPQPIFGKCRLCRGGPFVPGKIWLDASVPERPAIMLAEINGREADVQDAWIRLCGNPITESEYRFLMATKEHVERYEPDSAEANPTRAIDLHSLPPVF